MAWFQKDIDYARDSLTSASESAIDRAGERLSSVVQEGVHAAGQELKEVVAGASKEIDAKLDKISVELHNQRQFTKDDVKELVDYAADKLSAVLDDRIQVMKREISDLVEEKTEYFKVEVDGFFVERQKDLARERRRMVVNIGLAFVASLGVGVVSLFFRSQEAGGPLDPLTIFRVVLAALTGGYVVYLFANIATRWLRLTEHRKDAVFLAMRYWGVLHPESVLWSILLLLAMAVVSYLLFMPELVMPWLNHLLAFFRLR
ncbi:MAG: hypothetical protein PHX10_11250 [Gallionellaceae bacterium]|nr:hypothetical protein [Gallionellaceae bacterium]